LKKIGQLWLFDVAGELDARIAITLFLDRIDVAGGLRMVAASDHKLHPRMAVSHPAKSLNHQLQALIRSPLTERQNAVHRVTATRKFRKLGATGEHSVGSQVNVSATIFFIQNLAVSRHEHRNRIRHQEHSRCHCSRHAVHPLETDTSIAEFNRVHQMMQGHVREASAHPRQNGSHQPGKCD
jgi:hypothetical protein